MKGTLSNKSLQFTISRCYINYRSCSFPVYSKGVLDIQILSLVGAELTRSAFKEQLLWKTQILTWHNTSERVCKLL